MRWERLFDDLEAQLASDDAHDREAEIADRTRRERALIGLHAKLLANVGSHLGWWIGGQALTARVVDVGPDWVLTEPAPARPVLLRLESVRSVSGLRHGAQAPSVVARRFTLGLALGAISRDRAPVGIRDIDGRMLVGTIDVVGADHVEVAEHPADEPRRPANVTAVSLVPFASLAWVRWVRPHASQG
ncbi:MAG TPA: hypothetical protein VFN43_04795 [Humibacillus sp.]|nr:hypothetical protein [Humibacillus sp.]